MIRFGLAPRLAITFGWDIYIEKDLFRNPEEVFWWELRESNPRPSACKADALNQLS